MATSIKKAIEDYNSKSHRHLRELSPNQMEEALFLEHGNKHPEKPTQLIVKNENSLLSQEAKEYKRLVADQFKGNWLQFFVEWKSDQEKYQKQVIAKLTESTNKAEAYAKDIEIQYKKLYHSHLETQKHVEFLCQQAQAVQQEKEQKKLKRKNAKKQKIRQTVSYQEFEYILFVAKAKGRANTKHRRRLALVLLFLTGLKVSNLLLFKVAHGSALFEEGYTNIPLIKGGESRYPLGLNAKGRKILLQFKEDFIELSKHKTADMPLFTASDKPDKAISRKTFYKELNSILTQASINLEKHIRTHSFRWNLITKVLKLKKKLLGISS